MPNPHWHGALLNDRGWYVIGWLMGLAVALGLMLVVEYTNFQRWFRETGGVIGMLRNRRRRDSDSNVAVGR